MIMFASDDQLRQIRHLPVRFGRTRSTVARDSKVQAKPDRTPVADDT
jgi:hypothetical protein